MAADAPAPAEERDRVLPATRILAGVIVPVLVAAFIMLYLLPHETERLFAWPVRPPMTSMMLGATYLGGAYFFARVVSATRWHQVTLGFLPVAALCLVLGAATALHWDRFTHGHISFILWVILYFSLPVILPAAWYRNQRTASAGRAGDDGATLSRQVASAFGSLGAFFTGVGLLLFLAPDRMIPTWPWELTPLTARVVSALFLLTGLIGLSIAADRRWGAVRFILQAQTLAVVLILAAVVLARRDLDWSAPASWSFVAGLLVVFALVATVLYRYGDRTPEAHAAAPPLETADGS
jgi:hypothetical protein